MYFRIASNRQVSQVWLWSSFLPLPSRWWDYRYELPHLVYEMPVVPLTRISWLIEADPTLSTFPSISFVPCLNTEQLWKAMRSDPSQWGKDTVTKLKTMCLACSDVLVCPSGFWLHPFFRKNCLAKLLFLPFLVRHQDYSLDSGIVKNSTNWATAHFIFLKTMYFPPLLFRI